MDNETTPGSSVDQCSDLCVRLAQARNQTTAVVETAVVEADDGWLAAEDLAVDVADENDEDVMLTTMKK